MTVTAYVPAGMAGATQVTVVVLTNFGVGQAVSPMFTSMAPETNIEPRMVRVSPPRRFLVWLTGLTDVMIGGDPARVVASRKLVDSGVLH